MKLSPTSVQQPQWLSEHTPNDAVFRRRYVAPQTDMLLVDTYGHFLDASFGGGHNPGGQHDDITDDPGGGNSGGGGGHNPGGQHDDITGVKPFDFGWDEFDWGW